MPQLVELLTREHNPNIMLLAARALTNLMEARPLSAVMVVHETESHTLADSVS